MSYKRVFNISDRRLRGSTVPAPAPASCGGGYCSAYTEYCGTPYPAYCAGFESCTECRPALSAGCCSGSVDRAARLATTTITSATIAMPTAERSPMRSKRGRSGSSKRRTTHAVPRDDRQRAGGPAPTRAFSTAPTDQAGAARAAGSRFRKNCAHSAATTPTTLTTASIAPSRARVAHGCTLRTSGKQRPAGKARQGKARHGR